MDHKDKYIGQLLDNRYEIIEKIGEGGMAIVYKALCHRLNRYVAVKILKDELAIDDDFLRRFHTESQAVAMLSHPNIVNVYDVSRSSETEYMVMELIEGITLKQYMQRRGVLTWKEVLHFSTQIAKALSHAHSRGIIHRDIKPHNILILADSSVKVTDFGIARLTNIQDTLTNETLGSVHYISPEQAKGGHIDARTDIYSLGVVMYEMLTGRLPFEGDSAVSVAIQHISSMPLQPREINPDVPVGLETITMRAMASDLNQRYQSAEVLYDDLESFRKNPDADFDYSEKEIIETVNPTDKSDREEDDYTSSSRNHRDGQVPISRKGELSKEDYAENRRRSRRVSTLSGIFCVIIFIIAVFVFLWNYWLGEVFSSPETMTVPELMGSRLDDVLINPSYTDYYNIIPSYEASDTVEAGYIISQTPTSGRTVIKNTEYKSDLKVVVSSGDSYIIMPNVVNNEYRQAYIDLQNLKLEVEITNVASEEVTEGYVISSVPEAGVELNEGDKVYLTVSSGPEIKYVDMPNLVGRTVEAARGILESSNLTLGTVTSVDDEAPEGEVIFQNIVEGTEIAEHTKVNISISNGSLAEPPTEESTEDPTAPEEGGMLGGGTGGEAGGNDTPPGDLNTGTETPVGE